MRASVSIAPSVPSANNVCTAYIAPIVNIVYNGNSVYNAGTVNNAGNVHSCVLSVVFGDIRIVLATMVEGGAVEHGFEDWA